MTRSEIIKLATFMLDNYTSYPDIKSSRLCHCMAWRISSNYSKWILLQSYKTIVAAYDKISDTLYVFDYYSNTTCMHVSKFRNWIRYEFNPVSVKRINLYNDSKTGKRVARKNLEDDFESVIVSALNQR